MSLTWWYAVVALIVGIFFVAMLLFWLFAKATPGPGP